MTAERAHCSAACKLYNATAAADDPNVTSSHATAGCCVEFSIPFIRSGIAIMTKIQVSSPLKLMAQALVEPFVMRCLCVLIMGVILVGIFLFMFENWSMTDAFHTHWQDGTYTE